MIKHLGHITKVTDQRSNINPMTKHIHHMTKHKSHDQIYTSHDERDEFEALSLLEFIQVT